MQAIRSFLFNIALWTTTIVLIILGLPIMLGPPKWIFFIARTWGHVNYFWLRILVGIKYEITGQENLPDGPAIYAFKHQSMWETMLLCLVAKHPAIILKNELTLIPGFGWLILRVGSIAVKRGKGRETMQKMLDDAQDRLDNDYSLAIFPEGTRKDPYDEPHYKIGIGEMYANLNVPCVPIALNSGMYWARRSFIKNPGTIKVEILPIIEPGLSRDEFMALLQDRIETRALALRTEAEEALGISKPA